MTIKYRELMKEYDITFDSDILDPAFKSKAQDFEKKLAMNALTDEEIKAADDELVDLFKSSHNLEEVDSEEVQKAIRKAAIAEAKVAIAEADTIEALTKLGHTYESNLPEVFPLVEKKLGALKKQKADSEDAAMKKLFTFAKKEIAECPYNELQAMGEKYKTYPELVEIIKKRHEDENPAQASKERQQKLLSKKQWSYGELKALGITPTGNDMVVDGVKLDKEYLLNVYSVRR